LFKNDLEKLLFPPFLIYDGLRRSLHSLFGHAGLHCGCPVRGKEKERGRREGKRAASILFGAWLMAQSKGRIL